MNAGLLRAVLTHVEDNPALFDVSVWAEDRNGEVAADIGGRALLLSGWTLTGPDTFRSPDGSREIWKFSDIEAEALRTLDLTEDEYWDSGDLDTLFNLGGDEAVKRLRELTEEAEAQAVRVNG